MNCTTRPSSKADWFSSADADDCQAFNRLLRPERQERLAGEGGYCIVATHLGKGFVIVREISDSAKR